MDINSNFFSKFYLICCFFCFFQVVNSQTKEEKQGIEDEAQRLFRTDVKKSIKLYEYLLENTEETDLLHYRINMVRLKLMNSENIEAIDLMFDLQKDLSTTKDRHLQRQFYQLEAEVFKYFGFTKESGRIQKPEDFKNQNDNSKSQNTLFNIADELQINPDANVASPQIRDIEKIEVKLNQNIALFTKARYLAQLRQYYLLKKDEKKYMIYDKQLLDLQGLHLYQIKIARNYLASKLSKLKQEQNETVSKRIKTWSLAFSFIFIGITGAIVYYPKDDKTALKKKNQVISDKAELKILERLQDFENSQKYLDESISITILAKKLDTNVKYLSAVLNNQKQKSFNQYINELRIHYITERLKSDKKFRGYKISYLATACGFTSHSSFTSSFKSIVGITASAYINKLNEEDGLKK